MAHPPVPAPTRTPHGPRYSEHPHRAHCRCHAPALYWGYRPGQCEGEAEGATCPSPWAQCPAHGPGPADGHLSCCPLVTSPSGPWSLVSDPTGHWPQNATADAAPGHDVNRPIPARSGHSSAAALPPRTSRTSGRRQGPSSTNGSFPSPKSQAHGGAGDGPWVCFHETT